MTRILEICLKKIAAKVFHFLQEPCLHGGDQGEAEEERTGPDVREDHALHRTRPDVETTVN